MRLVASSGALRIMVQHIEQKKNTWYFKRRIPRDVLKRYPEHAGKKEATLFFLLKTKDAMEAAVKANAIAAQQDKEWVAFRANGGQSESTLDTAALALLKAFGLAQGVATKKFQTPEEALGLEHFHDHLFSTAPYGLEDQVRPKLPLIEQRALDLSNGAPRWRTLSDAKDKHFALGGRPKGKQSAAQFNLAWNLLLEVCKGDIAIEEIRREEHVNKFVNILKERGRRKATIERYLSQISPVIETGIREFEISCKNHFKGVLISTESLPPKKERLPFSDSEIRAIQKACRAEDDQRRWALAMVSDTGARLNEIIGLAREDVAIDPKCPHILIRPNKFRTLKNNASERKVPLVGEALWAAQRALSVTGPALFPVFIDDAGKTKNAGASATLNKWLKARKLAVANGQVVHSLRHSMVDRLRNIGAPSYILKQIQGWSAKNVMEGYGKGADLSVLKDYLLKVVYKAD